MKLGKKVVRIPAWNNCSEAKNAGREVAGNLENYLFLCEGAEIVLK